MKERWTVLSVIWMLALWNDELPEHEQALWLQGQCLCMMRCEGIVAHMSLGAVHLQSHLTEQPRLQPGPPSRCDWPELHDPFCTCAYKVSLASLCVLACPYPAFPKADVRTPASLWM